MKFSEQITDEYYTEGYEETWESDVVIQGVCKQWNSKREVTVRDINLSAFGGQVCSYILQCIF